MDRRANRGGCCQCCLALVVLLALLVGLLCSLPLGLVVLLADAAQNLGPAASTLLPDLPGIGSNFESAQHPGSSGAAVAQAARSIAEHLFGVPDVFYDDGLPQAALAFWQGACPAGTGCWNDWQNGNLQCVELVTAAYTMAGHPLPVAGNAVDFWSLYAHRAGWQEIATGQGLPAPGDILVWSDAPPGVGHVAVVLGIQAPRPLHAGTVTFAQANGPRPLDALPVRPHLTVDTSTWPGYQVLGMIRPTAMKKGGS